MKTKKLTRPRKLNRERERSQGRERTRRGSATTKPPPPKQPPRFFSNSTFSFLSTSLHFCFSSTVEHARAPPSTLTKSLLQTAIPNPIFISNWFQSKQQSKKKKKMMMFKTLNRFLKGTRSRREKTRLGGVRKHVVSRWWLFGGGGLVATDPLSGSLSLPLLLSISRFGFLQCYCFGFYCF